MEKNYHNTHVNGERGKLSKKPKEVPKEGFLNFTYFSICWEKGDLVDNTAAFSLNIYLKAKASKRERDKE